MPPRVLLYALASTLLYTSTLADPTVKLDSATFSGSASGNIESFLGIPFAEPPTGRNRFRLPQSLGPYSGTRNASAFGHSCPQHAIDPIDFSLLPPPTVEFLTRVLAGGQANTQSEDCLTINVIRPAGLPRDTKLPVVAWIYGGGFQLGSSFDYNGTAIVDRSIALGQPVIYVSMNYRVAGFGFMPGKEIKEAKVGNLGLHDQRAALRWVKKYISRFGGDPTKTTIWGESAGALSATLQMTTNDGNNEGLFRGAFMQSGAAWSQDGIERGQQHYDAIVRGTGCSNFQDSLECLRRAPFAVLKAEMNKVPSLFSHQSLSLTYAPRVDGVFIKENAFDLVSQRKIARVPFVQGNCDDEGTLFTTPMLNITTTAQVKDYFKTYFLQDASDAELDHLLELYPEDPVAGSPFDTGDANAVTTQFKRIAALLGDVTFQAPRRHFMQELSGRQASWSYLYKRNKSLPVLGALHSTDLDIFAGGPLTDYLIRFVNTLNPNGLSGQEINWPQYRNSQPGLLTFYDDPTALNVTRDTYRRKELSFLKTFLPRNPF